MTALPTIGQIVRVRSRQYLVDDVVPTEREAKDGCTLVRLACLADDAIGERLEVLWEKEIDGKVVGPASWDLIARKGFDKPNLFSAYVHTLRWNCVTATNPELFQAPYRAGIEVKAYQLEPLRKALAMPRVNLFIADDVGIGKTIEAGLILRELLLRQKVRRTVILCPPSVVQQWREEMEQRFGLTFVVMDRDFVGQKRRERGFGTNPWTTHSRFILSHALVRDEGYAIPLADWLGEFSPGSLLIVDEAHNFAPASGARYAVDSALTKTLRGLAPRFEHRLFLSATPHNGHSNSFAALLEILDPLRFCRGVPVKGPKLLDAVMVRRLKSDLREIGEAFPDRQVIRIALDGLPKDAPELVLSALLERYRSAIDARLEGAPKSKARASKLVLTSLQKRLLSSVEAFYRTLRAHMRAIDKVATTADRPFPVLESGVGPDDERGEVPEEELEAEEDAEVEAATRAGIEGRSPEELALLAEMRDIAERARHEPDAKVRSLVQWIRANQCPTLGKSDAAWNDRRVLVFTEYTDTKRYLQEQLGQAIARSDRAQERILTFHGEGLRDGQREAIKAAFNADPKVHPLRILIATDAAREGVNLQNHCADLFHFDVPWNPSRMEQRNGRIDRKLQREKVVRCHYFVLPQRAEDRVLDVLVEKTRTIQEELGALSPVVENQVDRLLQGGIAHPKVEQLTLGIGTALEADRNARKVVADELDTVRDRREQLAVQVEKLQSLLGTSKRWLSLDDNQFREALSAALELMGVAPLQAADPSAALRDPSSARWIVPALDERIGADPTWTATLDTLRPPRKQNERPAEWRKASPIRPILFRDPGTLDIDAVHLHLEHRVVQRLLGRFKSQGFLHDELTRACVLLTDHPTPLVLALGRLSLYGEGAARLHDEILAVAAEWIDPRRRGTAITPLASPDDAMRLLELSLATARLHAVKDGVTQRLSEAAPKDVFALEPHLEARAHAVEQASIKLLTQRGKAEGDAMRKLLEQQIKRIEGRRREVLELLANDNANQLTMFRIPEDRAERRQLDHDRDHWEKDALPKLRLELDSEPARIRSSYTIKARRSEPVGLVYLWPVSA